MLENKTKIEGLRGVGTVELNLQEKQHIYTLIGNNGVGKTKTLEALFQMLFFHNSSVRHMSESNWINLKTWVFKKFNNANVSFNSPTDTPMLTTTQTLKSPIESHHQPVVFLASQNRGFIQHNESAKPALIGSFEQRRQKYFDHLIQSMATSFTSMNMDISIEEWFITLAQSSNTYQKREDNRDIELTTVISLLNKIDSRIDAEFLQISGDGRVNLKIDGQLRELSHLSTGFASIVKIIQAIISGYSHFTNEKNLANVKGIVLIDEIESHLHLSWQVKILPLFKRLFPKTTFYVTTHSSLVLSQLKEGEAYRLKREADGVVRSQLISAPNKVSLIDVLQQAFDIDLNELKIDNATPNDQKAAKQQLLDLLNQ